ncbi:MAG: NACHT domain-containing protein [Scytonematopsis contorta HA4267-MV1]|jgi:hypothetical protein|nr:NACHT domain-containing protein [Scytonematopsis contorta HA4267-MV1]
MSDSDDEKKVSNNDLRNAQFGGGFINAENVNAQRIGGDIFNYFFGQKDNNQPQNSRNRFQLLLLQQVSAEVESRISSSLHNRVYIVLDTEQNPSQVECPWQIDVKVGSQPKVTLHDTEIITVFDQPEIAGRLLILGQPGAGKTTMLLQLADKLVKRALNNPTYPVPVLFSLPSWKNDKQGIKDWLVEQLKEKYGVRKDIGKQWVDNQDILPLLDGLDELAAERQELCVNRINDFLDSWANPLVICSRIEEYQRYQTLLQLNNSLELSPFTSEQVCQYLESTGNLQLYSSISQDEDLNQLARTPFLLNVIVLSAQEMSVEAWRNITDSQERLDYLFDAYVRRMLKRQYKGKRPESPKTLRWLIWLARRLDEEKITVFYIEQMQPYWLKNKIQIVVYNLITWVIISGLTFGLIMTLIVAQNDVYSIHKFIIRLVNGLTIGSIIGLIIGLFNGLIGERIEKYIEDKFNLINRPKFFKEIIRWLIIGMISGMIIGLINALVFKPIISLIISLIFLLVYIFMLLVLLLIIKLINNYYKPSVSVLLYWLIFSIYKESSRFISETFVVMFGKENFYFFFDIFLPDLIYGLVVGIIFGLVFGLILGLIGDEIIAVESFMFSPNKFFKGFIFGVYLVLIFGSLIWQILTLNKFVNQVISLFDWLIYLSTFAGVFLGVFFGIKGLKIEYKNRPNQGIHQSSINTIIISTGTSLLSVIFLFLNYIIIKKQAIDINQCLAISLFAACFGILVAVFRSGTPAIKHYILHIILWFNGYIPWNYAKFLDYATNRLFLQRVGGSYRFVHDLLRQHFAKKYSALSTRTTSSNMSNL